MIPTRNAYTRQLLCNNNNNKMYLRILGIRMAYVMPLSNNNNNNKELIDRILYKPHMMGK